MDNENNRFGSASFARTEDVLRSPDLRGPGMVLGYVGGRIIRLRSDAPLITFAGSWSGKLRDKNAYNVCGFRDGHGQWHAPRRMLINDPRGELAAISIHNQVRLGKAAFCINPRRLHGLPSHRVNPWDMLRKGSPTLHADTKHLIADLILSARGNEKFFTDTGRNWSEALVMSWIDQHGSITLPAFYDLINAIEDPSAWEAIAEAMLNSGDGHVRSVAAQMDYKRDRASKEYSAVIATIQQHTGFLSDPDVRSTLSGSDFSPEILCEQDCNVYLMPPAEEQNQLAAMTRAIYSATMRYKFRHPSAPRVTLLIDEAAQLGNFESLLTAYTYARGMGICTDSSWQNPGQITRNFGQDALAIFIGSSQCRQIFGVRDIDTAKLGSAMLGQQTLEYDDKLAQDAARRNLYQAIAALLNGADPMESGRAVAQFRYASGHRSQQARPLMAPDELMNMPEHQQLLFISGVNLRPILADKYPYYTRPEMAGAYLPNPYHPPYDHVPIAGHSRKWARVITERVPACYAHLPQYQSGQWSYVEGFRPCLKELKK
jgi:type IV secretion system protein VirD4